MLPATRRSAILKLLQTNESITVTELSRELKVSEMTIRRDLRDMDRQGLLHRVHGGAVSTQHGYEPPYVLRQNYNREAKQRIGREAAALIADGDSIAFDVGTTTLEVARALRRQRKLTIVTSSLPIANELIARGFLEAQTQLVLTGGLVRAGELSLVGNFAEAMYSALHVDKAFIGIAGLSLKDGLTEYNLADALVKRAVIASAGQRIVVADSSKFNRTTFAVVCALSEIHTVVTDAGADAETVQGLSNMGIEVVIAG